jgi:integration host factor subunit beta
MNKSDLLRKLKEKRDTFPEEDLESSINLILHFISRTLEEANRVEIRNFGTFSARKREKRLSRNPKTGTSVLVNLNIILISEPQKI